MQPCQAVGPAHPPSSLPLLSPSSVFFLQNAHADWHSQVHCQIWGPTLKTLALSSFQCKLIGRNDLWDDADGELADGMGLLNNYVSSYICLCFECARGQLTNTPV
jgi:hypothetical protein